MRSLIYGYGDTGKSFERYLKDKKIDFDIFDSNIAEHNQNYNFKDFDQICAVLEFQKTFLRILRAKILIHLQM